jgi:hypothetical protein
MLASGRDDVDERRFDVELLEIGTADREPKVRRRLLHQA